MIIIYINNHIFVYYCIYIYIYYQISIKKYIQIHIYNHIYIIDIHISIHTKNGGYPRAWPAQEMERQDRLVKLVDSAVALVSPYGGGVTGPVLSRFAKNG
jgi:ATP-dependent protease Clp ATPase subunit